MSTTKRAFIAVSRCFGRLPRSEISSCSWIVRRPAQKHHDLPCIPSGDRCSIASRAVMAQQSSISTTTGQQGSGQDRWQYLNQVAAQQLDVELMDPAIGGFSIDQLMELAGLSVACALAACYPVRSHRRVLVVAGPGNNGGDALVAARHLAHFGYAPYVVYPKQKNIALYTNLVTQCRGLHLPVEKELPANLKDFDVILDGIFGFSFKGDVNAPFDKIIQTLNTSDVPIFAIDIPSGWDVERGDISGQGIKASALISLTAPKLCAKLFRGPHYLGGRFVPRAIADKYDIGHLCGLYPDTAQCVLLHEALSVADMRTSAPMPAAQSLADPQSANRTNAAL